MSTDTESKSLRDIAVDSGAAETLTNSVWSDMAIWVAARDEMDMKAIKEVFANTEVEYKSDFSRDSMPAAYRSAKSVALKAKHHGVKLVDERGAVRGKTAVEQDIKDKVAVKKAASGASPASTSTPPDATELLIFKLHTQVCLRGDNVISTGCMKMIEDINKALTTARE